MNEIKNNILWVDYAKFIGIFLMILGHIIVPNSNLYCFIYLFHMPLFFIVSGYLYRKKSAVENYKKLFGGLFIPYLLYQFLYLPLVLYNYVIIHNQDFGETLIKSFYGIFQGATISNAPYYIVCGPCWFIMTIMFVKLFFSFFNNKVGNILVLSAFSIVLSKVLILNKILLPCCLNCTILAIPYFGVGMLFRNYKIDFAKYSKYFVVGYMVFAIIILNLILDCNGLIKMSRPLEPLFNMSPSLLLMYLGGILGSIMVFTISGFPKKEYPFVDIISKNTLFIIFAQEFILYFLKAFKILDIFDYINSPLIGLLIAVLFSVLILYMCYIFICKFRLKLPLLFGIYRYKSDIT